MESLQTLQNIDLNIDFFRTISLFLHANPIPNYIEFSEFQNNAEELFENDTFITYEEEYEEKYEEEYENVEPDFEEAQYESSYEENEEPSYEENEEPDFEERIYSEYEEPIYEADLSEESVYEKEKPFEPSYEEDYEEDYEEEYTEDVDIPSETVKKYSPTPRKPNEKPSKPKKSKAMRSSVKEEILESFQQTTQSQLSLPTKSLKVEVHANLRENGKKKVSKTGKNKMKAYKPSDIMIKVLKGIDYEQLAAGKYAYDQLKSFASQLNIRTTEKIEDLQKQILDLLEQYIDTS